MTTGIDDWFEESFLPSSKFPERLASFISCCGGAAVIARIQCFIRIPGAVASGVDCNQVGAGPNLNKAAKLRRDIPNDMDNEEAGSSMKRERGMCLGLDAKGEGFTAKLQASIDLNEGRILPDVQLCSKPRFNEPGFLTLGLTRWQMDENRDLVLGYHNGNKAADHPRCKVGGTVPVVEVDDEWVVPEWALWFIRRGKVVLRDTNSKRHG